ncbi:MAG: aspartyl protease family protein [Candidatus Krumholzibacteria bacterium]|nr:aspartyl protease family protein [Candidatus Krumholzibacteria bacterium]
MKFWARRAALIVTFLTVALAASTGRSAEAPSAVKANSPVRAVAIDYLAHLPMVKVLINGKGPYNLVVDTGAGVTVLDKDLVAALDLPVMGTSLVGSPMGAERIPADSLAIRTIEIGDVVIENKPAVALQLQDVFSPLQAPDGILAAASLDGFLVTIDFPNSVMMIRRAELPPADGQRVLDYGTSFVVPDIPISIAGEALRAALDTGAPSTVVVPSNLIATLPLVSEPVVTGTGRTVDAEFEILSAQLKGTLNIGHIAIDNPRIAFSDRSTVCHIGMGILRELTVTIDRTNRRVAFEQSPQMPDSGSPTRRVVRGGSKKSYGIMLGGLSGDVLEVIGVEQGLVAATAGLVKGDRIIAMNGRPVKTLGTDERIRCLRGSPLVLQVERGTSTLEMTLSFE